MEWPESIDGIASGVAIVGAILYALQWFCARGAAVGELLATIKALSADVNELRAEVSQLRHEVANLKALTPAREPRR